VIKIEARNRQVHLYWDEKKKAWKREGINKDAYHRKLKDAIYFAERACRRYAKAHDIGVIFYRWGKPSKRYPEGRLQRSKAFYP